MTIIDKLEKQLAKVNEQIELFQEKKKELLQQLQEAEDAESLRIIKKKKISPEQLQLLNELSEEEILCFMEQKQKEKEKKDEEETLI